jgi:hypothetical protein
MAAQFLLYVNILIPSYRAFFKVQTRTAGL